MIEKENSLLSNVLGYSFIIGIELVVAWILTKHKLLWMGKTLPKIEFLVLGRANEGRDSKARIENCYGGINSNSLTCDLVTAESFSKINYSAFLIQRGGGCVRTDANTIYTSYPGFSIYSRYWVPVKFDFENISDVDSLNIWIQEE